MAKRLMNLHDVPEDEADEIRALLESKQIAFYETRAGFWGIIAGAIWLNSANDFEAAKKLLNEYQVQRQIRVRAEFSEAEQKGESVNFWDMFRAYPLKVLAVLLSIIMVIAVSTLPLWYLAG